MLSQGPPTDKHFALRKPTKHIGKIFIHSAAADGNRVKKKKKCPVHLIYCVVP